MFSIARLLPSARRRQEAIHELYGGLLRAVHDRDTEKVRHLLEAGVSVNGYPSCYGESLSPAVRSNWIETVRLLLDYGADANAQDEESGCFCPLNWAAAEGNLPIVRLLVERGADVNASRLDRKPLMNAAASGRMNVLLFLLEAGAKIEAESSEGHTALTEALIFDREEAVTLLRDHGARLRALDAVVMGEAALAHCLAEQEGPHPRSCRWGSYLLIRAAEDGDSKRVNLLLDLKVDPNVLSWSSGTALNQATYGGQEEIVHLLLERGADPNLRVGYGKKRALRIAVEKRHTRIVTLLRKYGAKW